MKLSRCAMFCAVLGATTLSGISTQRAFADAASAIEKTTTGTPKLRAQFEALRKVELDGSRGAKVENLVIQKDITKISLTGTIWFSKPSSEGAKPTGAWFSGDGRIQMTPPVPVEKESFKKALDKDSLDEKFTQAFIRFNDDFYDLLKDKLAADSSGGSEAVASFRKRQKALDDQQFNVEFPLINDAVTEGPRQVQFLFEFEMQKLGWIAFLHAPGGTGTAELLGESLYFFPRRMGSGSPIITVFHEKAEYESGRDLGHEDRDAIWIRQYKGTITVDKDGLLLKPKLDMEIESMFDGLKAMTLDFLSFYGDETRPLTLEVVSDASGKPLEYLHRNGQLLIVLPKAMKKGDKTTVHVEYTADFIRPDPSIGDIPSEAPPEVRGSLEKIAGDYATFTLLNTFPWFPQSGFLKRHTIDWVVRVPVPFLPVASGVTEKRWKDEEGYNCIHTVETTPIALSSILFGRYYMQTDSSARPTINVYTLAKQQKQASGMLAEARSIVSNYEKWFGPFPFGELDIAQMGFFYGFGQAPPGLVQLTGEAFLSGAELQSIVQLFGGGGLDPSFVHAFVAHEIGHEWWGHAVSWANSNDQWLSESYTEYCSGLYVQSSISQKAFEAKLRTWRDHASRSKDSGAIWLGGRLGRHYTNQIYNKGPYVLHMLRLALQAQAVSSGGKAEDGDKLFFDSLKNFISQFRNQNATTKDFQKVVKATAKVDMDWFFDQWFYGNNWLSIAFKYDVKPTEDGKFLLTASFKQPDKDKVKSMTVPMDIHIGGKTITKMVFLTKAEQVVQLKLAVSPDKVTLDDNHDLLADITYD